MKIGALAAAAQTPVETIRYYEKQGLLPAPPRSEGNYRVYGPPQVERLRFIRHCRGLDMSLDEIRLLLRFKDSPDGDCADVNALLDEHIGHVSRRVRELKALERQLKDLRSLCRTARQAGQCGILQEITQAATRPDSRAGGRTGHLASVHDKG